ncbi:MAG: hypothetical protein HC881_02650 [Leptolyngbyaceae cyanobacterium SL_7_1]|nr:hypothetical protein [Leptolyngbyaceae cyanobacterium SL_7_1]
MTDSSTPVSQPAPRSPVPPPKPNPVRSFLVLVFRLLLLGVGSGVAWVAGMAIAQVYPAQIDDPPLVEKMLRYSQALADWGRQFPQSGDPPADDTTQP